MNAKDAAFLGRRLIAAFPAGTAETSKIFAEKMADWDHDRATDAVETLIDYSRGLPTVFDLREAYLAAGGSLPDASRNMSPERPRAKGPTVVLDETEIRAVIARLTRRKDSATVFEDDEQETEMTR